MGERRYNTADAAFYCGISDTYLREQVRKGRLEAEKSGRCLSFRKSELDRFNGIRTGNGRLGIAYRNTGRKEKGRVKTRHYKVHYTFTYVVAGTGEKRVKSGWFPMLAHRDDTRSDIIDKAFRMLRDDIEIRQNYSHGNDNKLITRIVEVDARWEYELKAPVYTG